MKNKMANLIKKMTPLYEMLQYASIVAYIVLVVANVSIPFIVYVTWLIVQAVLFVLCKDYAEHFERLFMAFRLELAVASILITNQAFTAFENLIKTELPFLVKFMFFFIVGMLVAYLLFVDGDKKRQTLSELKIRETLGDGNAERNLDDSKFDVKLCIDKETKEDVYLLSKDRFLHMLVLGPTGGGKTSQILIPMILQDIQRSCGVIVIEPKGDLAEMVYAMGVKYKQPVTYFNPVFPDCPRFNPLDGEEDAVIETLTTTFDMLSPDSKTYYKDLAGNLIRKALMVVKRLEQAYTDPDTGLSARPATLITLSELIHNTDNKGRDMVNELATLPVLNDEEARQNLDTQKWFLNEYFADRSVVFQNTSGIRTIVSNLIQNKYLRKVLNPPNGKSELDFDKILADGGKLSISTAQGELRALGSYLGYFIILSLQSAVFRRPGDEFSRNPCFLYIDEFQTYSNPGFSDMLTQGRSYRVSSNLATQSRGQMAMGSGNDGRRFLEVVAANARNVVLFPGIAPEDAEYFSKAFGEKDVVKDRISHTEQQFRLGYGFKEMNYPTETVAKEEKKEARYTATDIAYKDFEEMTYKIIKNNSVQFARDGIIKYIDKDINDELKWIVGDYRTWQLGLLEESNRIMREERAEKQRKFLKSKGKQAVTSDYYNQSKYSNSTTPPPQKKKEPEANLWGEVPQNTEPMDVEMADDEKVIDNIDDLFAEIESVRFQDDESDDYGPEITFDEAALKSMFNI